MFDQRKIYVLNLKNGFPKKVICGLICKLRSFLNQDLNVLRDAEIDFCPATLQKIVFY